MMAIKSIRQYAHEQGIKHVFILGDLMHNKESLDVHIVRVLYDFFKETKEEYEQEWYVFPGNHDMYYKYNWKSTTLHCFSDVLNVLEDIHRIELYGRRFWIVPFMAVDKAFMDVVDDIDKDTKKSDVILTHIGCIGAIMNFCFLFKEQKAINFDHRAAGRVYTGHFHCYHRAGIKTWYTGSPIPFNFDEGTMPHGFLEYDCDTGTHEFIDLRPLMKKDNATTRLILPPSMPSITLDEIENLTSEQIQGEHFRIILEQHLTEDMMRDYRNSLINRGAKKVRYMRLKDTLIPESALNNSERIQTKDLFNNYFQNDNNGDKYNSELMNELNNEIMREGDSLYAIENMET